MTLGLNELNHWFGLTQMKSWKLRMTSPVRREASQHVERAPGWRSSCGWGLRAFLRWWPPSIMWAGPLIYFWPSPGMSANNPIFSNLGLCAACCARFMCHHELWPTSVSHPFSSLNSSPALLEENTTRKLLLLSLDLFFEILLFRVAFPIFFSIAIFSPYFLQVVLLLQYSNSNYFISLKEYGTMWFNIFHMWLCFSQGSS